MKQFKFFIIVLLIALLVHSCKQKEESHYWEDPGVGELNAVSPHTLLIPFQDFANAINGMPSLSSNYISLNGIWKFKWMSKSEMASKNFFKSNYDVSKWDEIEVPSNWYSLGYVNKSQPPSSPPLINTNNPAGSYYTKFNLPEEWSGKHIILRFEGVQSAFKIWINGKEAGYGEGSTCPFEFDITPYVQMGENTLAARVYQWSDMAYMEENIHSDFSGINRDVFIYAVGGLHIQDISLQTDFDETYKNAELKVTMDIKNSSDQIMKPQKISVRLLNHKAQTVLKKEIAINENVEAGRIKRYSLLELVEEPVPWCAEKPYLYTLLVKLDFGDTANTEIISRKIGFREIEIKEGRLLINGKALEFRGVNFAGFSPKHGNVLSREEMIADIIAMKKNNINSVITKYGPHSPQWYDLFDEYGLYVWDQINFSSSNISTPLYSQPNWKDAIVSKGMAMIHRDKNHPSVIVWSLGNKVNGGDNIEALRTEIEKIDNRPVHYGNFSPNQFSAIPASRSDIISVGDIPPSVLNILHDSITEKPIILCNFVESFENSTGRLQDYWNVINQKKRLLGAFLNEWVMQGIEKAYNDSLHYYEPLDKQEPGYGSFSGLVYPDRVPTPALHEVKYTYQPVLIKALGLYSGVLSITNKHTDTNLKYYDATWEIARDGKRVYGGSIYNLDVEPGQTGTVKLPYSSFTAAPGKEYFLNIRFRLPDSTSWAQAGYEVAWAQYKLPFYAPRPESLPLEYMRELEVSESNENYILKNKECFIAINKTNGYITSYRYGEEELMKNGPEINFWRPPTDMDRMEEIKYSSWKEAELDSLVSQVKQISIEPLNSKMVRVYVMKSYANSNDSNLFDVNFSYTIYGNGSIEISGRIIPVNYVGTMAKAGLQFTLPQSMNNIEWFGKGPYATYPDRDVAMVSVYNSTVDGLFEHYYVPQENANRSDVRWVTLADSARAGLLFQSYNTFNMSAYKYSDKCIENAKKDYKLKSQNDITLNIDFRQTGLGKSFDTPEIRSPYMIYAEEMDFTIYLRPYLATTNLGYMMGRRLPGVAIKYPAMPVQNPE